MKSTYISYFCPEKKNRGRKTVITLENGIKFVKSAFLASRYKKNLMFKRFYRKCNHDFYVPGTSWHEIMGIEEKAVIKIKNIFCTHYKNMGDYLRAKNAGENVFQGKPFCSFVQKQMKETFYILNPLYKDMTLKEFLTELGLIDKKAPLEINNNKLLFNNPLYPPKGGRKALKKNPMKRRTRKERTEKRDSKDVSLPISILRLWRNITGIPAYLGRNPMILEKIERFYRESCDGRMENLIAYYEEIRKYNNFCWKKGKNTRINFMGAFHDVFWNKFKRRIEELECKRLFDKISNEIERESLFLLEGI